MATSFTIGRLSATAGVHVETIRYYQRRGLLKEPDRPLGGFRRYDVNALTRLQFVRRAQAMGFTLEEIAGLLEVKGPRACEQTLQLTEGKLAQVRQKIADLHQLEHELQQWVVECSHVSPRHPCPTLDYLGHSPAPSRTLPSDQS